MTDEVHKWGALAGVELGAGGVKDNLATRYVAAAFDRYPSSWVPKVYTYEADEDDIERLMQMYAEAAQRAIDAGFDILYIHGAAGVFPAHALSRHFNRRTDKYGGSFDNRARFWIEALETLRRVAGDHCAIATRFAIDDLAGPWGIEMYDEGLQWVELANRHGLVDLWDIIFGGAGHDAWGEDSGPSRFYKSNHQAPWNSEVKRIAKVPVVGVGRFTDPDEMVRVIKSGQLDIIGCARPSIADPWLPRKIDEGRVEDICECIGCNVCISRFNLNSTDRLHPESDRHGGIPPRLAPGNIRHRPAAPPRVLVVGAGPSGMECARVLALARLHGRSVRGGRDAGRPSAQCRQAAGSCRMEPRHHLPRVTALAHAERQDHARHRQGHGRRDSGIWRTARGSGDRLRTGSATGSARPVPIPCRASTWHCLIA